MSFIWADYLVLARQLQANPPADITNAALRAAISRAYYAAFGTTLEWAARKYSYKIKGSDGGDHGSLIHHLKVNNKREIANKLSTIRDLRETCDYKNEEIPGIKEQVIVAIDTAQTIINLLT
jgi:uncharacterized protein (UPF0332 family)